MQKRFKCLTCLPAGFQRGLAGDCLPALGGAHAFPVHAQIRVQGRGLKSSTATCQKNCRLQWENRGPHVYPRQIQIAKFLIQAAFIKNFVDTDQDYNCTL